MGFCREMRESGCPSQQATHVHLLNVSHFSDPQHQVWSGNPSPLSKAPGAQRPNPLGALLLYLVSHKPQISGSGYSNRIYFSREHEVLRIFPEHLLCWLVLCWEQGALKASQI